MTQPTLFQPRSSRGWQEPGKLLPPYRTMISVALTVAVSWCGIYFVIARPMVREIAALEGRLGAMTERMDQLVAERGTAAASSDLLSVLAGQQRNFAASRESLAALRQLRVDLEQEARLTEIAEGDLARLAELQEQIIRSGGRASTLQGAIESIAAIHSDVEAMHTSGQRTLRELEETDAALARLSDLQQRVVRAGTAAGSLTAALEAFDGLAARVTEVVAASESGTADLEAATTALTRLGELKGNVAAQSERLEAAEQVAQATGDLLASLADTDAATRQARSNADELRALAESLHVVTIEEIAGATDNVVSLLAMHDLLADGAALQMSVAERNLRSLLGTQQELLRTTPQIVAAAENLELLCDFHDELTRQLQELPQMRLALMEISLLQDSLAKVTAMMQPLTQLSSLRRLDADSVRVVAREILARRTAQVLPLDCEIPTDVTGIEATSPSDAPRVERLAPPPVEE